MYSVRALHEGKAGEVAEGASPVLRPPSPMPDRALGDLKATLVLGRDGRVPTGSGPDLSPGSAGGRTRRVPLPERMTEWTRRA